MYNTIVINVDELWLKGKNRPLYFKALKGHLNELLKTFHPDKYSCANEGQRFVAKSDSVFADEVIEALLKVPGVHSVIPSRRIEPEFDNILPSVLEEIKSLNKQKFSFKVKTKRADKSFPMSSMEISREIGHLVLKNCEGASVDVHNPDVWIEIRILRNNIYVSSQNLLGVGGLPVGTSGHLITMLSGGFDSPVASYLMSKRGCKQTFIFFYAYPYVGDEVKEKIVELSKVLGTFQKHSKLYVVPFGEIQKLISKTCKEEYRTLLFRKFMIDCSKLLADKVKADAVLTGDALGQVSSQTIGNISFLDQIADISIFRPLVAFNKAEIIDLSRKIGTHDISVKPHDDACSLFAPKHPVIRPNREYLDRFCSEYSFAEQLQKALDEAEVLKISLNGQLTS